MFRLGYMLQHYNENITNVKIINQQSTGTLEMEYQYSREAETKEYVTFAEIIKNYSIPKIIIKYMLSSKANIGTDPICHLCFVYSITIYFALPK